MGGREPWAMDGAHTRTAESDTDVSRGRRDWRGQPLADTLLEHLLPEAVTIVARLQSARADAVRPVLARGRQDRVRARWRRGGGAVSTGVQGCVCRAGDRGLPTSSHARHSCERDHTAVPHSLSHAAAASRQRPGHATVSGLSDATRRTTRLAHRWTLRRCRGGRGRPPRPRPTRSAPTRRRGSSAACHSRAVPARSHGVGQSNGVALAEGKRRAASRIGTVALSQCQRWDDRNSPPPMPHASLPRERCAVPTSTATPRHNSAPARPPSPPPPPPPAGQAASPRLCG